MSAGKGDKPRSCFSKQFKSNYDEINWDKKRVKRDKLKKKERLKEKELFSFIKD